MGVGLGSVAWVLFLFGSVAYLFVLLSSSPSIYYLETFTDLTLLVVYIFFSYIYHNISLPIPLPLYVRTHLIHPQHPALTLCLTRTRFLHFVLGAGICIWRGLWAEQGRESKRLRGHGVRQGCGGDEGEGGGRK